MRFSLASIAAALFVSTGVDAIPLLHKGPVNPNVIAHTGNPVGDLQIIQNVTTYITRPRNLLTSWPRRNTAIVYLTDVFGIELLQNKLLADSFARAGYLTVAPDMFQGEALSTDIDLPNFNMGAFLAKHTTAVQDPIIAKAVAWAHAQPGIDKVAIAGYCWGGKYAFRFLADGKGVDAAFSAHPSLLLDPEVTSITKPVSVAYAEVDDLLLPARRGELEGLLLSTGQAYQTTLYSGTHHGFAVRAEINDPEQKFGKEEAFLQAVRWFDHHL